MYSAHDTNVDGLAIGKYFIELFCLLALNLTSW